MKGRKKADRELPEIWRDIRETEGLYQVSSLGRVRKIWPRSGKMTMVAIYRRSGYHKRANQAAYRVHMTLQNGARIERPVIKLVAEAFFSVPDGMIAVHRNGLRADNSVKNILFVTEKELGERYGARGCRRPVARIDRAGVAVAYYTSARAAARANYINYQSVMDRCNGKVKNEFALDGYSYRWDDGDERKARR